MIEESAASLRVGTCPSSFHIFSFQRPSKGDMCAAFCHFLNERRLTAEVKSTCADVQTPVSPPALPVRQLDSGRFISLHQTNKIRRDCSAKEEIFCLIRRPSALSGRIPKPFRRCKMKGHEVLCLQNTMMRRFSPLAVRFYCKNNQRQITACPDLQSPLTSLATKNQQRRHVQVKIMRAKARGRTECKTITFSSRSTG